MTTLNVTSPITTSPVATWPIRKLATPTISSMMFIGFDSWPRATDHRLGGGSLRQLVRSVSAEPLLDLAGVEAPIGLHSRRAELPTSPADGLYQADLCPVVVWCVTCAMSRLHLPLSLKMNCWHHLRAGRSPGGRPRSGRGRRWRPAYRSLPRTWRRRRPWDPWIRPPTAWLADLVLRWYCAVEPSGRCSRRSQSNHRTIAAFRGPVTMTNRFASTSQARSSLARLRLDQGLDPPPPINPGSVLAEVLPTAHRQLGRYARRYPPPRPRLVPIRSSNRSS